MSTTGVSLIGFIYEVKLLSYAETAMNIETNYLVCRLPTLWNDGNECSKVCEQVAGEDFLYNVNGECATKPDFVWNARFTFEKFR